MVRHICEQRLERREGLLEETGGVKVLGLPQPGALRLGERRHRVLTRRGDGGGVNDERRIGDADRPRLRTLCPSCAHGEERQQGRRRRGRPDAPPHLRFPLRLRR